MTKAVETEFKNILSASEYQQLLSHFSLDRSTCHTQHNMYFDTTDHALKEKHMGLRLRVTDNYAHITLKEPGTNHHQMLETTDHLPLEAGRKQFETGSLTVGPNVGKVLQQHGIHPNALEVIGSFITHRNEKKYPHQTWVVDACEFEHFNDYELEMETDLPVEEGLATFETFLADRNIPRRPSLRKIQRMQQKESAYAL
ncbi:MAG: CYTH domain-containing protein [Aerococcus sp.]|nr:CYTH domain-containing protein [Aerococcus sp.]